MGKLSFLAARLTMASHTHVEQLLSTPCQTFRLTVFPSRLTANGSTTLFLIKKLWEAKRPPIFR